MTEETKESILRQVVFLRARGHAPHRYVPTDPYRGCRECGQGPGALQHNTYLVRDFCEIYSDKTPAVSL